jgi:hypothetical protein
MDENYIIESSRFILHNKSFSYMTQEIVHAAHYTSSLLKALFGEVQECVMNQLLSSGSEGNGHIFIQG